MNVPHVAATSPSVTPAQTTIAAGNYIAVNWADIATPAGGDWIGFYPAAASDDTAYRIRWQYTGGAAAGTTQFLVAATDQPGAYQFRLFADNSLTRLATSATVTVGAPQVTVSTAQSSVAADNYLTVSWSGANARQWGLDRSVPS